MGLTNQPDIFTIDLDFLGMRNAIAVYLIPHKYGGVLVECGPTSTFPTLNKKLQKLGYSITDITDVFLTHIHLDHAGAAGVIACTGANIHVHERGAPHLINPEKLLRSASRIYGNQMDYLWGEFLPVPENNLTIMNDQEILHINELKITAIDTPGHANHHLSYILNDTCFTGDLGGIRLPGPPHIRLPMPPPEFHLEKWETSIAKLTSLFHREAFHYIAPTHFGIYNDPEWHLIELQYALNEINSWMEDIMPNDPPIDTLTEEFLTWTRNRSLAQGLDPKIIDIYEAANPSFMSSYGIQRYWKKYRTSA